MPSRLDISSWVDTLGLLFFLSVYYMLSIKHTSEDHKDMYKVILDKRKDNIDALYFLKIVDESDECCFLTGKAGTGKSTLIKDIIDFCKEIGKAPLVLGSTGISALNVGGQTVHSFFSLGIENVFPKEIKPYLADKKNRKYKLKKSKIQTLINVPFVVIDEIGMLNANTIDCVDLLMKKYLAKESGDDTLLKKPFGGKPVIFVGDVFQLPPVSTQERKTKFGEVYASERFFDSMIFKNKLTYQVIELKKNYRQEYDTFFWDMLDGIRNETISDHHLALLNKQIGEVAPDIILLSTHRGRVDEVNTRKIQALPGREYIYEWSTDWFFPDSMKKADMILRLKKWAKVMMVTNDILGKRINGSMGTVQDLWEDYVDVEIGGEVFMIGVESRENKEIIVSKRGKITENILGSYEQFPLKLAYAITVHKSQGMTFDACNLDLCNTFTWGQAYTALSRSKTLSGITLLNKIERRHLFFHPSIKTFTQNNPPSSSLQEKDIFDYVHYFD